MARLHYNWNYFDSGIFTFRSINVYIPGQTGHHVRWSNCIFSHLCFLDRPLWSLLSHILYRNSPLASSMSPSPSWQGLCRGATVSCRCLLDFTGTVSGWLQDQSPDLNRKCTLASTWNFSEFWQGFPPWTAGNVSLSLEELSPSLYMDCLQASAGTVPCLLQELCLGL